MLVLQREQEKRDKAKVISSLVRMLSTLSFLEFPVLTRQIALQEAAEQKRQKDREDREKQKEKAKERKEAEKKRTQKGERRR